jgi:hypothetical protein
MPAGTVYAHRRRVQIVRLKRRRSHNVTFQLSRPSAESGTQGGGGAWRRQWRQNVRLWRIVAISASPVATTPSPGHPNPPRHDPGDGFIMRHVGVRRSLRDLRWRAMAL